MQSKRPNIVMIVLDSARFDRLGIHGYRRPVTRRLDALAEEVVDYTNANAPGGSTRPSMGSNFTGLYPQAYGFAEDKFPDEKHTYVAERLRDSGYETYVYSSNAYVSPATGYTRGFEHVCYVDSSSILRAVKPTRLLRHTGGLLKTCLRRRTTFKVISDLIVGEALDELRRRRPEDPPIFLYIHLDVHHPYLSDRRYLRPLLEPGIDEATVREVERLQRSDPMMCNFANENRPAAVRERYWSVLRSMYDASYQRCDEHVGVIIDTLQARRLWDSTMLVVTADHGELIGERGGQMSHGFFPYDEVMRVPLLVKYPRELNKTGTCDRLMSTIDLVPTYCELAAVPLPADQTQGRSLLSPGEHEFVVQQRWNFIRISFEDFKRRYPHVDYDWLNLGHVAGLKDHRYKFIWTSVGKRFLFDLQEDPGETRDLAPDRPDLVQQYEARWDAWCRSLNVRAGSEEPEYDKEIMDQLRRLGYVE